MLPHPDINLSIKKPPLSVLIYNYKDDALENCLKSILEQNDLKNLEIVICDDASSGATWKIANDYTTRYPGRITVSRNSTPLGKKENRQKGIRICNGEYIIALTEAMRFDVSHIIRTIETLSVDTSLRHDYIFKKSREQAGISADEPLVSVCIYNYNYGRYLKECLDSVFSQTYKNIEVHFSDNASTDESWKIALEYQNKYPEKISITRNRVNFGPAANLENCITNIRGKYVLKLCSDDYIAPTYVERCVDALKKHPDAGFVMVHRNILDDSRTIHAEPPFYDGSYLIPGSEQAAVYMMTSVNPCISQILYNTRAMKRNLGSGNLGERWFGDRIVDFCICFTSPIIYLNEPLLINRVHGASDGEAISRNLMQCIGEYCLVNQFADTARHRPGMEKAANRLPQALRKISDLCLRYATRSLIDGNPVLAQQYFHLSFAISPEVENNPTFVKLGAYMTANDENRKTLLKDLRASTNLVRREFSYPPPEGSIPLPA